MFSVAILSGCVVMNYLFGISSLLKDDPRYKRLFIIAGLILMISGFANIFLIKGKKKLRDEHKLWGMMLKLKFAITLVVFTPIFNPILGVFCSTQESLEETRKFIHFYLVLIYFIWSTLIKTFREDTCNNFEDDEVYQKVQEL